jgi:hypothetical protein
MSMSEAHAHSQATSRYMCKHMHRPVFPQTMTEHCLGTHLFVVVFFLKGWGEKDYVREKKKNGSGGMG